MGSFFSLFKLPLNNLSQDDADRQGYPNHCDYVDRHPAPAALIAFKIVLSHLCSIKLKLSYKVIIGGDSTSRSFALHREFLRA